VHTELWSQLDREFIELGEAKELGEAMNSFSAGILLGRIGQFDDVADLASFLCSPASNYITGQLILCDGGMGHLVVKTRDRPTHRADEKPVYHLKAGQRQREPCCFLPRAQNTG